MGASFLRAECAILQAIDNNTAAYIANWLTREPKLVSHRDRMVCSVIHKRPLTAKMMIWFSIQFNNRCRSSGVITRLERLGRARRESPGYRIPKTKKAN
jgi:hypothetical protein